MILRWRLSVLVFILMTIKLMGKRVSVCVEKCVIAAVLLFFGNGNCVIKGVLSPSWSVCIDANPFPFYTLAWLHVDGLQIPFLLFFVHSGWGLNVVSKNNEHWINRDELKGLLQCMSFHWSGSTLRHLFILMHRGGFGLRKMISKTSESLYRGHFTTEKVCFAQHLSGILTYWTSKATDVSSASHI